jgi:hypothetical protein
MKSSINNFDVVLDEPSRIYSPGEHVNGKVVLDLKQETRIRKLNLECRGEAYVSWPENYGTYTRYHFNKEELFLVKACVYGEARGKLTWFSATVKNVECNDTRLHNSRLRGRSHLVHFRSI